MPHLEFTFTMSTDHHTLFNRDGVLDKEMIATRLVRTAWRLRDGETEGEFTDGSGHTLGKWQLTVEPD